MKNELLTMCRKYLSAPNAEEAGQLLKELDAFGVKFDKLASSLFSTSYRANVRKGYLPDVKFTKSAGKELFPTCRMYNYVPDSYCPEKPHGVLIFLHGGGKGVENNAPASYFAPETGISDIFKDCSRIVCLPSAPPNQESFARWHLPEVDEYLFCVIDELRARYNIDDNNIILGGTSMGGMGVNSVSQRLNDRFASFLSSSSQWDLANWSTLKNTDFWILQAVNDASMFRRRHGTDIEFARALKTRLEQVGAKLHYREHCGHHSMKNGRHIFKEWLGHCKNIRRDPYNVNHVVAVSPCGCTPYSDFRRYPLPKVAQQNAENFDMLSASAHSHWVTVGEIADETIIYDMAVMTPVNDVAETSWNDFEFKIRRKHLPGGIVEAVICDRNTIEITPVNVKNFSIYLHPAMVDFNNLRIYIQGEKRFDGKVKPALSTMLQSYLRRRDPKALYYARLDFADKEGKWLQPSQIK